MAKIYYDQDADLELIKDKNIAILGYGSQGHAHALNLKDNGCRVRVGLYKGSSSWSKAEEAGLTVGEVPEVVKGADIIVFLIPDHLQADIYTRQVQPAMAEGSTLMWAHGFNIHFQQVLPPPTVDVTMVAPKAPGHRMRELFTEGLGVPGLLAVHQDVTGQAQPTALAYAKGIGCTRAGVLATTFQEETETDLFGEQVVLCGGVSALIKASFETLVEAGYQPESAYFECLHELKLIVDLMYQGGLNYMRYSVSDTAEYGDYTRGPRIITDETRQNMRKILQEIQDGTFAQEWIAENREGRTNFLAMRQRETNHPIEEIGKDLRQMMGWLKKA